MKKVFKTIDLFAGIGGIRLGFESTGGFKTVFANDSEPNCKLTYDLNFSDFKLHVSDIRDVKSEELPEFDILLGGFPCQAFSVAGYREGFKDRKGRGHLFFEIERILKDRQPTAFLIENVKNLESHDNGKTFEIIMRSLHKLGFYTTHKVLNSMEYGNIPQTRERIYIVGFSKSENASKFKFPNRIPLKQTVHDVLENPKHVTEKYYYNKKPLFPKLKEVIHSEDTVYQWRRKYVRENKNNVFPTLTANMGTGGHNVPIVKQGEIIRKITPKECARVQGFPDDYLLPDLADSHLYKQFGNSVSIPVINKIAINMYKALT